MGLRVPGVMMGIGNDAAVVDVLCHQRLYMMFIIYI